MPPSGPASNASLQTQNNGIFGTVNPSPVQPQQQQQQPQLQPSLVNN